MVITAPFLLLRLGLLQQIYDQSLSQSFVLARKAIEGNIDLNRKKDGKRMKLHGKSRKSTELKINIGIMTKKENALVVKRGVTLSVTVRTNINY